jgi:hypothetical protein
LKKKDYNYVITYSPPLSVIQHCEGETRGAGVEAPSDRDMGAMTPDENCHRKMYRTPMEVAWIMGVQVSKNKRDEGKGEMTPGRVEDRCAVVKFRREAGDVIGK